MVATGKRSIEIDNTIQITGCYNILLMILALEIRVELEHSARYRITGTVHFLEADTIHAVLCVGEGQFRGRVLADDSDRVRLAVFLSGIGGTCHGSGHVRDRFLNDLVGHAARKVEGYTAVVRH